jgi:hypothetical protein
MALFGPVTVTWVTMMVVVVLLMMMTMMMHRN